MTDETPSKKLDIDLTNPAHKLAAIEEIHRRGMISEEEYQDMHARFSAELAEAQHHADADRLLAGLHTPALHQMPKNLQREVMQAMRGSSEARPKGRVGRWTYSWNSEPEEDPFAFLAPLPWDDGSDRQREIDRRRQSSALIETLDDVSVHQLDWLWPQKFPLGKLSLLTGDAGDGKSLVVSDLIARLTTGRDWPDGTASDGYAEALFITPEAGRGDIVSPRLRQAGADLSRIETLSSIEWEETATRQSHRTSFQLPEDGPLLEAFLNEREHVRLVVIDPLSHFLHLPDKPAERSFALHELLADLEWLAEARQVAIVCVESARRGGVIGMAERTQWRAAYDPAFKTVWGVARDPRDRTRRLLLPVRHHLGDDRTGLRFTIEPGDLDVAQIEWGDPDDTITYAEATGRVRLGRSVWSFSQTADAEAWLRVYLKDGEKASVDIFIDAREQGFSENPVRDALRRVATKRKEGYQGSWIWRLK